MEILTVSRLSFDYPDGTPALREITCSVQAGESVGILGATGAGKTTLLLHLNGILRGNGSIAVCGCNLAESSLREIRRRVGMVFQNPDDQLFSSTVFEDVSFAPAQYGLPPVQVEALVEQCLTAVGLHGYRDKMPHHLSAGEKKKIALAAVLAQKPDLLVLDEPSSNLDPKSRRQFISLVKSIACAKIIASHDIPLIRELCSRVILLDRGGIAAQGPTADVLSDHALLRQHHFESAE